MMLFQALQEEKLMGNGKKQTVNEGRSDNGPIKREMRCERKIYKITNAFFK